MATESIGYLLDLASGDSPASRWLAGAIARMIEGKGWHDATGIKTYQVARAVRDGHLRHAADLIGGDPVELHKLAARFESVLWPRWRRSGPPADCGPVNRLLFLARQAAPLPKSVKQFRRILGHQTRL